MVAVIEDFFRLSEEVDAKLAELEADMTPAQREWAEKYKALSIADQMAIVEEVERGYRSPDYRRMVKVRQVKQRRRMGGRP
jgi:hypothetical protein